MLRENLDTVLKDLLEFKNYENVSSEYPGPHLDLQNLQENYTKKSQPNRAPNTKSKFHLLNFPYDIKDTLSRDDYKFDTTTSSPVSVPTLNYSDVETQSNPEGLRYSIQFETTKYVHLDNSPTTVSNKKKKWEKSKETLIHSILNYMHLNASTTKPDKSEIVYRIRRYLNRELKHTPVKRRSGKSKIHHYFFEHDHVKRFYKSENPATAYKVFKSTNNNKMSTIKKHHKGGNNFLKTKPKFRKVQTNKRVKIGRKLQMYTNVYKRNIIPLNRKRQIRNARESTELKPITHRQSSVSSPVTKLTTEKSPSETKPGIDLINQDPAKGDAALKARFLFKSCMNYEILEKRGHQPLLDLLNLLGGWPILDPKWKDEEFNWIELMAKLRLYNNDILISEWVGPDIKNSDEFVIQFDQTSLGKNICVLLHLIMSSSIFRFKEIFTLQVYLQETIFFKTRIKCILKLTKTIS